MTPPVTRHFTRLSDAVVFIEQVIDDKARELETQLTLDDIDSDLILDTVDANRVVCAAASDAIARMVAAGRK